MRRRAGASSGRGYCRREHTAPRWQFHLVRHVHTRLRRVIASNLLGPRQYDTRRRITITDTERLLYHLHCDSQQRILIAI
jgi:hypothetical protein